MPVKVTVEVKGHRELMRALKRVGGEEDAPEVRAAVGESGAMVAEEMARRAPGSIGQAVTFGGVKGPYTSLRAVGRVKHPGSRSMEFGRKYWPVQGRPVRHSPGQKPRPYLGVVKGDAAIGATKNRIRDLMLAAYRATWERIAP